MANNMGFAHFVSSADGVAWFVLGLLVFMSLGTWFLIITKGIRAFGMRRRSRSLRKGCDRVLDAETAEGTGDAG